MNDLARELSEVQILDQSSELETRVPTSLIMHATERYPPRVVEAILRCLSIHLRQKMVFIFMLWKLGLDHMLTMMFKLLTSMRLDYLHRSTMDQYTGLELDPVGTAAARQSEIDFTWRLKAFEPRPRTEAFQRVGRKPFGMRVD